jgi:hypothetical protein
VCSALCDSVTVVWNLVFAFLGMGALFGGLVIAHDAIPPYFRWAYYASIPGATQVRITITDVFFTHLGGQSLSTT